MKVEVAPFQAIAVNAEKAASMFRISRRHWLDLVKEHKAPQPIHIGRCVRWSVEELNAWVDARCPPCPSKKTTRKGA